MLNECTDNESKQKLKNLIEAIEIKIDQKKDIQGEINDLFADAKSLGFDVKAMKVVIKIRAADKSKLEQEQYMVDLYKDTLGINN